MHRVRYEALPVSLGSTVWCSISRATSHGDVVSRECIIQSDDIVHLLDNHAFIDVIHRVHLFTSGIILLACLVIRLSLVRSFTHAEFHHKTML